MLLCDKKPLCDARIKAQCIEWYVETKSPNSVPTEINGKIGVEPSLA